MSGAAGFAPATSWRWPLAWEPTARSWPASWPPKASASSQRRTSAGYPRWATHSRHLPGHNAERRPWRCFEAVRTAVAQARQQMEHQDVVGVGMGEGDVHIKEVNQEDDVVQEQRPQIS